MTNKRQMSNDMSYFWGILIRVSSTSFGEQRMNGKAKKYILLVVSLKLIKQDTALARRKNKITIRESASTR